jgi:HAD superfamily hydrolase (TIGR01509 family)
MDGVIALTENMWLKSRKELFKRHNASDEGLKKFKGTIAGQTLKETTELYKKYTNITGKNEDLIKERVEILLDIFNKELTVDKSVSETLENLSKKYTLALTSGSPIKVIDYIMDNFNLRKYFSLMISCDIVGKGKTAPDAYLYTAKKLNAKPENCIVIEDSPNGINSAKDAGMRVIAIKNILLSPKQEKQADFTVDNFKDIEGVINDN